MIFTRCKIDRAYMHEGECDCVNRINAALMRLSEWYAPKPMKPLGITVGKGRERTETSQSHG